MTEEDTLLVLKEIEVQGNPEVMLVNIGKVNTEEGRISTATPPFTGAINRG
ncbi:MAG: hypothetical protein GY849_06955, partial [Deltaproteobacteria bacterium]|nr:hypothetical protein [Deltaproteobacteria bacterium]